jgi:hypothetical protein
MKVYVASSLHNYIRVRQIQQTFRDHGHEITYDWTPHGETLGVTAPTNEELGQIGLAEEEGVLNCDLLFMVHPARNGSHVEFGIARAAGKPIVCLEEVAVERKSFYYMPDVNGRGDIKCFPHEQSAMEYALHRLRTCHDSQSS